LFSLVVEQTFSHFTVEGDSILRESGGSYTITSNSVRIRVRVRVSVRVSVRVKVNPIPNPRKLLQ